MSQSDGRLYICLSSAAPSDLVRLSIPKLLVESSLRARKDACFVANEQIPKNPQKKKDKNHGPLVGFSEPLVGLAVGFEAGFAVGLTV